MMSDIILDITAASLPEPLRRALTSISEVNALSKKDRAAYQEEQKRLCEMQANKAKDLFRPEKKIKSSISEYESLSDFLSKNITLRPLSMAPQEFGNKDPTDKKYAVYVEKPSVCQSIVIPCYNEIDRVDSLKKHTSS
jgi:hypothetical protein